MGKRVTVTKFDDLEPNLDADENLAFGWEGADYEIDLCAKNAAKFRKEMEVWVKVATRVAASTTRKRSATSGKSSGKNTYSGGEAGLPLAEIRKWALDNGFEVSDRGRVSAEIVRAWKAAIPAPTVDNPEFSQA